MPPWQLDKVLTLDLQLGSTVVGIQTAEGVVLGAERRLNSPLLEPDSIRKLFKIADRKHRGGRSLAAVQRAHRHRLRDKWTCRRRPYAGRPRARGNAGKRQSHTRLPSRPCWRQHHWFVYNENMRTEACVQGICDLALRFGEDEMVES